eukprot:PhM_4_TR1683/c0_g1_i1/m.74852
MSRKSTPSSQSNKNNKQTRLPAAVAAAVSLPPALPPMFGAVTAAVSAISLGLYMRTLHPTVAGGDSGELMAVAHELGVPHPPGYPTFAMYTKIGAELIRYLGGEDKFSIAYAQNAANALLSTLAVVLMYVSTVLLSGQHDAGLIAAFMYGFSTSVWTYAVSTEVFPMNNFFIALLLTMAAWYNRTLHRPAAERGTLLLCSAFVCGLSMTNQHTSVLFVVPIVLWVLWIDRIAIFGNARMMLGLGVALALGMSPYLYLPISATLVHSPNSWGACHTLDGFLTHFFRRDYGTFSLASKEATYRVSNFQRAWGYFFADMQEQTLGWLWLLAVVGAVCVFRSNTSVGAPRWVTLERLLLGTWLLYNNFFNYLSNLPIDQPLFLGVQQRFWIQPLTILCIFLGLGYSRAAQYVSDKVMSSLPRPVAPTLRCVLCIAICVLQVTTNFTARDESDNYTVHDLGRGILESMPPHAILLTKGDIVINSVRAVQVTERVRTDVRVIDQELMTYQWYNDAVKVAYPDVVFPGDYYFPGRPNCYTMKQFLDRNRKKGDKKPRVFTGHGFKEGDDSWKGFYTSRLHGFVAEVIPISSKVATPKSIIKFINENRAAIPMPNNFTLPPAGKYPETSWEVVIEGDYWTSWHSYAYYLLDFAQTNEANAQLRPTVMKALYEAKEGFELVTQTWGKAPSYVHRNLGVTLQTLYKQDPHEEFIDGMIDAFSSYIRLAPTDSKVSHQDLDNVRSAVEYYKQQRGRK